MAKRGTPYIIDIEASGFGYESYPIEVGLALSDGLRYCSLIKPHPNWQHWDASAEAVHQIPRDLIERAGKPIALVCEELNHMLEGKTVFCDGWVVDEPWVIKLFHAAGIQRKFAMYDVMTILNEEALMQWPELKNKAIKAMNGRRHRASFDALAIQEACMQAMAMTNVA